MSILATNKKLIKVGQEYSAGSGISIDDYVISVTGDVGGNTYSAGDNINIYEQDNQLYISGKDWEQDIANASANAYNAATAQIPTPFDPTYLSAQIDNKLNSSDFSDWQNGQYSTDLQTIEGQINNKLDSSSFSDVSGNFLTAINIPESATWNETSNVVKESSANWDNTSDLVKESSASWNQGKTYEGISPIVVNNDENKVSAETWTFSAGEGVSFVDDNVNKITRIDVTAQGGDVEVNSFVYDNSATILDVDSSYKANSGNFYPTNNPSGFITGVDLSNFYTKDETSGKEELANAFANIPAGDTEVNAYVHSHSASLDNTSDLVQANSSTWNDVTAYQSNSGSYLTAHQDISNKLDTTAFSTVSGDFLTTSFGISESATWNDTTNVVQTNSATWSQGGGLTGDYVSGTNTASITDIYTYNYSATISGDVYVDVEQKFGDFTFNTWHYSLFNVGSAVDNKLNAEYISASNTIKKLGEYDNHYEVVGKSYREANVHTISASDVSNDRIEFNGNGNYLKSAIITIESDTIGSYMPDWTLQSSAGGSAVLTKSYTNRSFSDSTYLWGDWNITNIDASATVYNGYEIAELAFKDEIPSVVTGEFVPLSSFNELKQSYDALSSLFATYSGQWLLPNEGV